MARSPRRDDEDALDPVEAADEPMDSEDDLDGFTDVDADGEPDLDEDDDELAYEGDDGDDEVPDADVDDEDGDATLPSLLEEDEIAVVVAETEEDDDEEDALRDGEFVCRSCFMAKRESALADADAMLCRDCA